MSIVNRYITFSIIKNFGLTLLTVLGIFIAIDYLGAVDNFMEAGISLWRGMQYVLLRIPFITAQLMPVVLLLSILIAFGLMSKNNELTVLNASGVSIYALVKPVMVISVACGALLFVLNESVAPVTMIASNRIKNQEIRKQASVTWQEKNIWIKGNRQITHIAFFDTQKQSIFGFTRYYFDSRFRLVRRIDAGQGVFEGGKWLLMDCMDQVLNTQQGAYHVTWHDTLKEDLQLIPDDFRRIVRKAEEMSYRDLSAYVEKIQTEGYDATVYLVDLYAKGAHPFICIILGLVGVGLTARRKLSKGLPVSISMGLGIAFAYWIFHSFCLSLGYGQVLPPFIAAWTANFVGLCFAVLLLLHVD
jgi:lipopolysaccharide export system permease protein